MWKDKLVGWWLEERLSSQVEAIHRFCSKSFSEDGSSNLLLHSSSSRIWDLESGGLWNLGVALTPPRHFPRARSRPASSDCTWGRARASGSANTPSPSPASPEPSSSPAHFCQSGHIFEHFISANFKDTDAAVNDYNDGVCGNLTLEAMRMEIFVQGMDPGGLKYNPKLLSKYSTTKVDPGGLEWPKNVVKKAMSFWSDVLQKSKVIRNHMYWLSKSNASDGIDHQNNHFIVIILFNGNLLKS